MPYLLVFSVIVASRFLPLPANFSPVLAIAILCGARLGRGPLALIVPMAAMFVSDMVLGFYDIHLMFAVYLSLVPMVWLGTKWNTSGALTQRVGSGMLTGFLAALLFFLVTNFAVWHWNAIPLYPHTPEGLWTCYAMALEFFPKTLMSTWLFMAVGYFMPVLAPAGSPVRVQR